MKYILLLALTYFSFSSFASDGADGNMEDPAIAQTASVTLIKETLKDGCDKNALNIVLGDESLTFSATDVFAVATMKLSDDEKACIVDAIKSFSDQ